ncbi:hypothetical protein ACUN9V_16810 [Salinicola sp. V024]|uniref:hypothetical protein n=1 Tax=Salinicola sp. V024 TaxID=3459609 RepID=UPI004044B955
MKSRIKVLILAIAVAATAPVFAAPGHEEAEGKILKEGVSSSQQLGGSPVRYQIPVARTGQLYLSSEHLASESNRTMAIEASLYSPSGQLLAKDSDSKGHFTLNESVDPGTYYLDIKGSSLGSVNDSDNRYNIHMGIK